MRSPDVRTFPTPAPVTLRVDVVGGSLRVRAGDRSETVVDVRPSNPLSAADVQAAEQVRVDADGAMVRISSPRPSRLHLFGGTPSLSIDVQLPTGSHLEVRSAAGDVDGEGRLGRVSVTTQYGDIRIERAATLHARTTAGDIAVSAAEGAADVATSYGEVRIREAAGDVRLESACGDVTVDTALGSVTATTKYGQVRVGEAVRGSLVLETAYGTVEAGVRAGTAAWLDAAARSGLVRNLLTETEGPEGSEQTVEIRARTSYGDVVIRRA